MVPHPLGWGTEGPGCPSPTLEGWGTRPSVALDQDDAANRTCGPQPRSEPHRPAVPGRGLGLGGRPGAAIRRRLPRRRLDALPLSPMGVARCEVTLRRVGAARADLAAVPPGQIRVDSLPHRVRPAVGGGRLVRLRRCPAAGASPGRLDTAAVLRAAGIPAGLIHHADGNSRGPST